MVWVLTINFRGLGHTCDHKNKCVGYLWLYLQNTFFLPDFKKNWTVMNHFYISYYPMGPPKSDVSKKDETKSSFSTLRKTKLSVIFAEETCNDSWSWEWLVRHVISMAISALAVAQWPHTVEQLTRSKTMNSLPREEKLHWIFISLYLDVPKYCV